MEKEEMNSFLFVLSSNRMSRSKHVHPSLNETDASKISGFCGRRMKRKKERKGRRQDISVSVPSSSNITLLLTNVHFYSLSYSSAEQFFCLRMGRELVGVRAFEKWGLDRSFVRLFLDIYSFFVLSSQQCKPSFFLCAGSPWFTLLFPLPSIP